MTNPFTRKALMKKPLLDLIERASATFAQAFLALEVVDQSKLTQLSALKAAAVAGGFAIAKFGLIKVNAFLAAPDPDPPAS